MLSVSGLHTYCHLGGVQTGSCCASSSPLPLGRRSYQWVLGLLPPESIKITHQFLESPRYLSVHVLEVAVMPTLLKKLSMKPSLSTATATSSSAGALLCTDEQCAPVTFFVQPGCVFTCRGAHRFTCHIVRGKGGEETYSGEFCQSILHPSDQRVSCPDSSSQTAAGSSCRSPCVERQWAEVQGRSDTGSRLTPTGDRKGKRARQVQKFLSNQNRV